MIGSFFLNLVRAKTSSEIWTDDSGPGKERGKGETAGFRHSSSWMESTGPQPVKVLHSDRRFNRPLQRSSDVEPSLSQRLSLSPSTRGVSGILHANSTFRGRFVKKPYRPQRPKWLVFLGGCGIQPWVFIILQVQPTPVYSSSPLPKAS